MTLRILFILITLPVSFLATAQEERDTTLKRCPVFITDTITSNNFFLEAQPAKLRVFRTKGDLTVGIEQRDQFFTISFNDKELKNMKYKITPGADGKKEVEAKYSFRSGTQVSYVNVANGTIETVFDKEKKIWHLKVRGMIANVVERSVTYYRVRADLFLKD